MPLKQANIHNADENKFPANNITTKLFLLKIEQSEAILFTRVETNL
jgi:hypothetical protein